MEVIAEALGLVPALAMATEEQLATIAAASQFRRLRPRDVIYGPGQDQHRCFTIKMGRAKLVLKVRSGEMFLHLVRPGELFGTESFWEVAPQVYAITLEPCTLIQVPSEVIHGFLGENPGACLRLMQQGAFAQRIVLDRMRDMVTYNVPQRLVRFLIFLSEQYGVRRPDGSILIDVGLSHQDLGISVGTSRETATTLLNELKNENLVVIGRKTVTLLNTVEPISRNVASYFPDGKPDWGAWDLLTNEPILNGLSIGGSSYQAPVEG